MLKFESKKCKPVFDLTCPDSGRNRMYDMKRIIT